jgi:ABC-type branched-subunit amino acid transport system ATPase component
VTVPDGKLPELKLSGISVRFGGLLAVDDMSLTAPAGQVTGLIGANGAGKTTTFNACCAVVPTTAGSVSLGDRCLDGMGTASRAQVGLGRTFQRIELVEATSVRNNVALGAEALIAGRHPWGLMFGSRKARAQILEKADAEMERCGLSLLAELSADELSTGQARLVELARVLTADYRFLLLDEPSSGLDRGETEHFGEIVANVVAERGVGILLVEHDMALVRQLCTYIYVMDFGRLLCHGPAEEVLASKAVRDAYLGTEPQTEPVVS